jgi:alginate O-acetyltransferase complex protein AlgI
MLFNTYKYFIFFAVVIGAFYAMPHRFRWMLLLAASYFYYMVWDPRYGFLILASTAVVYVTGLLMQGRPQSVKKLCVAASVVVNLGILAAFKYFNFINASIKELFSLLGASYSVPALTLVMPIGISFYTFQALSYTFDVYRGTRQPERNFGIFALFVSFFPVLLSGPIERSTTLLPQFYREVEYDYDRFTNGLKLMAWGYFQKMVIADHISLYVSQIHARPEAFSGVPILLAIYLFAIQVYCDFSGYTDMAIGAAQVLGYKLSPNFRRPFFSLSLGELWRRWHMTLISWLRDYLYIPLGGNRVPKWRNYFNLVVVFTLSGLWHGAQWTFVLWGALNGLIIIFSMVSRRQREWVREHIFAALGRVPAAAYFAVAAALVALAFLPGLSGIRIGSGAKFAAVAGGITSLVFGILKTKGEVFGRFLLSTKKIWMIFVTFSLFSFSGIFFGVRSVKDGWYMITHCIGGNVLRIFLVQDMVQFALIILLTIFLFVVNNIQEKRGSIRELIKSRPAWVRWALYVCLCAGILMLGVRGSGQFIYFRF